MMRIALQLKNDYIEFIKFSLVGMINTSVDFGVYIMLSRSIYLFSRHFLIAKALSFIAATVCSFLLNRRWTFNKMDPVTLVRIVSGIVAVVILIALIYRMKKKAPR